MSTQEPRKERNPLVAQFGLAALLLCIAFSLACAMRPVYVEQLDLTRGATLDVPEPLTAAVVLHRDSAPNNLVVAQSGVKKISIFNLHEFVRTGIVGVVRPLFTTTTFSDDNSTQEADVIVLFVISDIALGVTSSLTTGIVGNSVATMQSVDAVPSMEWAIAFTFAEESRPFFTRSGTSVSSTNISTVWNTPESFESLFRNALADVSRAMQEGNLAEQLRQRVVDQQSQSIAPLTPDERPVNAVAPVLLVPSAVTASSSITDPPDRYVPEAAFDGDPDTAWGEGVEGHAPGSWLEAAFEGEVNFDSVDIATGFDQISPEIGDLFFANDHAKLLVVTIDSVEVARRAIARDERSVVIDLASHSGRAIRFSFDEVWEGDRWSDLHISEVRITGARVVSPME